MPERWLVRLIGRSLDLERLHALFGDGAVRIERAEDGFALTADEFGSITDAAIVGARSKELLMRVSGLAQLNAPSMEPIRTDAIVRVLPDGTRHHHVFGESHVHLSEAICVAVGTVDGWPGPVPPPLEQTRLAKAATNSAMSEAIALFSGEKNWGTLYKVFELIECDASGELKSWAPKAARERFNQTANHQALSGRAARHATETGTPKITAMSLAEGRAFISQLLCRWLDSQ